MSKTILAVEDEAIIREMTVEFLEDADLCVAQAETADAALDLLNYRATEICLLFTDVRMPGKLDGLDLARTVMERWPHIKIIVTSGMFNRPTDAVPAGVEFLPKPWLALDMLTKVTRAAAQAC
jgi:DNA-binding NtrC family response regulator